MNNPDKMNIEKDAQELKLYMFTVQSGFMNIEVPEDFKAVMAYSDKDAITMVTKDYRQGIPIAVRKRAEVKVKKIVDIVNIPNISPQEVKITQTPISKKEKTKQDFVYGMMLVADTFITDKRDRSTLKRILKKIYEIPPQNIVPKGSPA